MITRDGITRVIMWACVARWRCVHPHYKVVATLYMKCALVREGGVVYSLFWRCLCDLCECYHKSMKGQKRATHETMFLVVHVANLNDCQRCWRAFCNASQFWFVFIIGRAEALPIVREVQSVRERERERERETEVVRRKWRHHCRAKIGDKFALSLAKNSHLSFPPSHFPSLHSRRGHQRRKWRHHCRAEIGDKFALSLAKNSHLSFPPSRGSASYIVREVQSVRERETEVVRRK